MMEFTRVSDLGLALDKPISDNYKYALPNKVFDYIQAGIPILCSDLIELKNIVQKYNIGKSISIITPEEIAKNITFENRLILYSDYLNHFGNIDVDWQTLLDLVVNQYVKANIGFNLIYDDDIKAKKETNGEQIITGPKVQLKQMLGIGLEYNF